MFPLVLLTLSVLAADPEPVEPEVEALPVLRVGIKKSPPFSYVGRDGNWRGISVELWERVADDLDVAYELEERDLKGLLQGVQDGSLDVGVAALTVTAEREGVMDFSHPFHTSGLGIAVVPEERNPLVALVEGLFSPKFFQVVAALTAVLLFVGFLAWLFERKRNPEFGGSAAEGLASGFWWSAVTMTTVGYGDKSPRTLGGRLVGLVWMFASIIMISSFTAGMASALTVQVMDLPVSGPEDLDDARVGSVGGSTSGDWLLQRGIAFVEYESPAAAMDALVAGEVEAVVYDAPILQYLANTSHPQAEVLEKVFQRQDYGFALTNGMPYRERINQGVLKHIGSPWWDGVLTLHLGG